MRRVILVVIILLLVAASASTVAFQAHQSKVMALNAARSRQDTLAELTGANVRLRLNSKDVEGT